MFLFLECTVDGHRGFGTSQGTCNDGQLCYADGKCRAIGNTGQTQGGKFIVGRV